MSRVLICSLRDDLHAYVVRHELNAMGVDCEYIAVDSLASQASLTWGDDGRLRLRGDGAQVSIGEVDVIWWRRSATIQKDAPELEEAQIDLINRDWRAALRGSLIAEFGGRWLSHPDRTDAASLKPVQLRAAGAVGLRVPKTLVSNEPSEVAIFLNEVGGEAVVKNISGTLKTVLFASTISANTMPSDESIKACPTMYQEKIVGTRHLRICIFGDQIHAAEIETGDLDWRMALPSNIRTVKIDDDMRNKLINYQKLLGLRMGVVDMKLTQEGEPVWLENNPQGQFLFVEGMTGYPLAKHFAEFIRSELSDE